MISDKQYKFFKKQVEEYENEGSNPKSEVGIQTDETPENTLIESLNDMMVKYNEKEDELDKTFKYYNEFLNRISTLLNIPKTKTKKEIFDKLDKLYDLIMENIRD